MVHRTTHHHSPHARSSKVTSYALGFLNYHWLALAASEVPILVHLVARVSLMPFAAISSCMTAIAKLTAPACVPKACVGHQRTR